MLDRGSIKWAPFNSIIDGKYLTTEIEKEKAKKPKPILSDEQISNIEKTILESYANKDELHLIIYQRGYFYNVKGTILKIDSVKRNLYLSNKRIIYFCEIIKAFI